MGCFMGIDAGTSGVKAIIMDGGGTVKGEGYAACEVQMPRVGWAEQNPVMWWNACTAAVKQAVRASGCGGEVRAVGLSGQMQGTVFLDKERRPIGNCIIWLDQRAAKEAKEVNRLFLPDNEILDITGSFCLPSHWAAKLLWFRRHCPGEFEKIDQVLFAKDYLRYRMTGEIATDVSDASLTSLLDLNKRSWSDKMFRILGIPKELVPSVLLESSDVAGFLSRQTAKSWGLPAGIPVAAGGGDQPVGGVGSGIVRDGMIAVSIGTSGVVFGCCRDPFQDRAPRGMYSLCHAAPQKYSFLGCTLGAGGSFKWIRDRFFSKEKAQWEREGKDVYDHMAALAGQARPGGEGVVFLPYLNGEATPHVNPDAKGVFFGLSYRHGLPEICRSVMEGVTYSLRDTLEIVKSLGNRTDSIRIMGGGAKSALWRQIQADVYQVPVVTMGIEEGPAAGAAILAAVGSGYYAGVEEACESICRPDICVEPIPENVKVYDELYQTYRELYPALEELFGRQARRMERVDSFGPQAKKQGS